MKSFGPNYFFQIIIFKFIVSVWIQIQSEGLPHGMLRCWRKLPLLSLRSSVSHDTFHVHRIVLYYVKQIVAHNFKFCYLDTFLLDCYINHKIILCHNAHIFGHQSVPHFKFCSVLVALESNIYVNKSRCNILVFAVPISRGTDRITWLWLMQLPTASISLRG